MGATKLQIHDQNVIDAASMLKALGHPARLTAFLTIVSNIDVDTNFKNIAEKLPLSQSTISSHLKILLEAGLIKSKLENIGGRGRVVYRGNHYVVKQLVDFLEVIICKMESKEDPRFTSVAAFYHKLHDISKLYIT